MIFTKFYLTISFFCLWVSAFSQTTTSISDTLNEEVVYEYDTVYLQPDTLRITETIEQFEMPVANAKKPSAISNFFTRNFSGSMLANKRLLGRQSFLSRLTPNYLSFGFAPFMNPSGDALSLPDSYTSIMVVNMSYSLLWNYTYGSFVVSVGPGFTRYHDKAQSHTSRYIASFGPDNSYSHDTLLIKSIATSNVYYYYLNIYTFIGYKYAFSKKLSLLLGGGGVTDILMGYSKGDANKPAFAKTRKYAVNAAIYTTFAYRPVRNLELFISPFYQRLLAINDKYPFTNVEKTGFSMGFHLFLK